MFSDTQWLEPDTLAEVKEELAIEDMETRLVSGGSALALIMKQGIYMPERLIHLKKLKQELSYLHLDEQGNLRIGALTTLKELEDSALVKQFSPVIVEALTQVANPRIRYVATIGGNLSHGDAHLDLPPILIALQAQVKVESVHEERWLPVEEFFYGYYETALKSNEILTEVMIPKSDAQLQGMYIKYTTLSNDDWPTLGLASFIKLEGKKIVDIRLVVSAVMDVPKRLKEVEELLLAKEISSALIEEAAQKAFELVDPLEDMRGTAWYKKEMVKVHVQRSLQELGMHN